MLTILTEKIRFYDAILWRKTWKGTHTEVQRSLALQAELAPPLSGLLRPSSQYSPSSSDVPGGHVSGPPPDSAS